MAESVTYYCRSIRRLDRDSVQNCMIGTCDFNQLHLGPEIQKMHGETKDKTKLTKKERQKEELSKKKDEEIYEYDEEGYVVKPRYQMVMSHSARRTCITLMYLSKMFTVPQMMSVSGHKKESHFREYIKLSLDEFADDVSSSSADGLF